jgi:hypothetical protein
MKKIIVSLVLVFLSSDAFAESIARSSLTYMINRYRETKSIAPNENREIALACAGEVFKDFANTYFAVLDYERLNLELINNYTDAQKLVKLHLEDVDAIYPQLRDDLIPSIRYSMTELRSSNAALSIPSMTIENYGKNEIQANFSKCNDTAFINTIAQQALLTGGYDDEVEGVDYSVPLADSEDDFEDIINGTSNTANPQGNIVTMKLSKWLYLIQTR